jgi:hypothetical protein
MALINTARLLSIPEAEAKSAVREGERPAAAGIAAAAAGPADGRAGSGDGRGAE